MAETLGLVPSETLEEDVKTKLSLEEGVHVHRSSMGVRISTDATVPEQAPGATKSASRDESAVPKRPSQQKSEISTKPSGSAARVSATDQKRLSRMKVRKQSIGMSQISGIKPSDQTQSQLGSEFRRPTYVYSNTYQLEPKVPFDYHKVTVIIEEILNEMFTHHAYSLIESPTLAMKIATTVLRRVKNLQFNRYRILSVATIGQKRAQSFDTTFSFIWDPERDSYVELHREEQTCFIQIVVFGIYLD